MQAGSVALLFVALAVIFLGAAFKNYLSAEGKLTAARKTWLHIAFIFAAVAIILALIQAWV
jgi:hypothetical protein